MAKLTKKEEQKLELQNRTVDRGETFVGFRPVVFKSGKYDRKTVRREGKALCRNF